jgi:hypothetical protein
MITLREAARALVAVVMLLTASILGQWLSANDPELLATWRFLNGLVLLFITIVLLFKWDQVRADLFSHRAEIAALVRETRDLVVAAESQRSARLEELLEQATVLAAQVSARAEEESKARHEAINERLDQLGVPRKEDHA